MSKIEEPKVFKVLRTLGVILPLIGVALIVLGATKAEPGSGAQIGMIVPGAVLAFLVIPLQLAGNLTRMGRSMNETSRYIQQESESDLEAMATKSAEISSEAVTITARAIKEGFADESIYCKHCGKPIDHDSTFCKHCGKEQ